MRILVALLLALPAAAQEPTPASFRDPAPPKVAELAEVETPAPKAWPGLTFAAPPRALAADAVTEDWPGFLGPRRDGVVRETRLLKKWPKGSGPRLVWSMERGEGYASPAVAGERVVFTHKVGREIHVDCLHAENGRRFWRHSYPASYRGQYMPDSGPRATPEIDGDRVYVHGVEGMLLCLELATGRVVWKRDLRAEFKLEDMFFGVSVSPLILGDRLITNLGAPGGPCVAAFDKRTGKLLWGSGTQWGMSCASPIVAEVHGRQRVFVLTGGKSRPPTGGLVVVDPSNGAIDFSFPFRSRTYESVNGANPIVAGNRVFLTAAYSTGTVALDLDAKGGYERAWFDRRFGIEFATPILHEGHLYVVRGAHGRAGQVYCLDAATGKRVAETSVVWDEVVNGKKRPFSIGAGCLVRADGAFLCLGDQGHLLWLEATPQGAEVLQRATLFLAQESWTPPVISRGLLYVCQNKPGRFGDTPRRLLCYDLRAGGE